MVVNPRLEERLQKLISAAGVASRRTAEQYILDGRVTVNGHTAQLGDKADLDLDQVQVDGKPLVRPEKRTYIKLYKPRGYVTTLSDEKGRRTVVQLVQSCGVRVWPVGRLDLDSEGLLLLTDDGDLTYRLIHPSHEVEKEYHVWVTGDIVNGLSILSGPLELDGVMLHPAQVALLRQEGTRTVLSVIIHEGRNRQVRRMCALAGLEVHRLCRMREGSVTLSGLTPGQWKPLTEEELTALR